MSLYRRLSRCHHQSHYPVSCDPLVLLLLSLPPQCKAEEFTVAGCSRTSPHSLLTQDRRVPCASGIAMCHAHPGWPCAMLIWDHRVPCTSRTAVCHAHLGLLCAMRIRDCHVPCASGMAMCHAHPGSPCAMNALTSALGSTGQLEWSAVSVSYSLFLATGGG